MKKDYYNLQCLQEKNYKDNFRKKKHKKTKGIKTMQGNTIANLQCFVAKYTVVILNQLNIKKIKLTKIILIKIIIKKKPCRE